MDSKVRELIQAVHRWASYTIPSNKLENDLHDAYIAYCVAVDNQDRANLAALDAKPEECCVWTEDHHLHLYRTKCGRIRGLVVTAGKCDCGRPIRCAGEEA